MRKVVIFFTFLLYLSHTVFAQAPNKLNSNQVFEKIQKLNFLGTVLYVAAHPDDENTRLISYLSNHIKARTAYLSLTRGDGGQNLIGPEIRELLGVIRTQELLAARRVDGGEQFFTRANDFGYSKHPDETLDIWDKEKVLSDVVWTIRNFKPDIIINRFNHRTLGTTHGHHTSSAMLSMEAFDVVNDPNKFPSQLQYTDVWQPKRMFFNTSWWFYGSQEKFENETKGNPKFLSVDVGVYYPLKGLSNNEVASMASSQHLCQGFGRLSVRGSQNEYLELLKGQKVSNQKNLFDGINTTWTRVEGGKEIGDILKEVESNFNFVNPSIHLPQLIQAYTLISQLKDTYWKDIKIKELTQIIEACAGLYLESSASSSNTVKNSTIPLQIEVLNRNNTVPILLNSIEIFGGESRKINVHKELIPNQKQVLKENLKVKEVPNTSPYWLQNEGSLGMYVVNNQSLIGMPETPRVAYVDFNLQIGDATIKVRKNVVHRFAKRDKGELYEPFEILPKVTSKINESVLVFSSNTAKQVEVTVRAGKNDLEGNLELKSPEGWTIFPRHIPISISQKGEEQVFVFEVSPPSYTSEGELRSEVEVEGEIFDKGLTEINYSHIPKQSVLLPSSAKVVRLNIKKEGDKIGYIIGAGDAVPESLKQIGYTVTLLKPHEISSSKQLDKFDAIVIGIRAYNTNSDLKYKQKYLLEYVEKGGNLVVQYNTSRGVDVMPPYSLTLSRDRVTNENSLVNILDEKHPVMNYPNKITQDDFKGWVQERGLYFPEKWSKEYTPILSMKDKGEKKEKKGSLLVARYGKGYYVYTGLSFFRELPAGVSGAFKLFANILSVGKQTVKE